MNLEYLHTIRDHELELVLRLVLAERPEISDLRILDVGAGTGRQAAKLAAKGFVTAAVDISSSTYAGNLQFPVTMYDGIRLPFPDASFDVVMSSNVLEHVEHLDGLLAETRRVLAPQGIAVHVLPSATWRLWTTLAYYPWALKRMLQLIAGSRRRNPRTGGDSPAQAATRRALFWPVRHGERGNVFTEVWYFSRRWWCYTFRRNYWEVVHVIPSGLFYTGTMLAAGSLGIAMRNRLAAWLGSSSRVYLLRPK